MIIGNDEELMRKLKHLSTTARVSEEYDHDMVGFNYRMTNIQAAVGCAQLERVGEFVRKKREIRAFYEQSFSRIQNISLFPAPEGEKSACWLSGIVLKEGGTDEVRKLCQELEEMGIEGRGFWKPIHLQKPYQGSVKAQSLDNASNLWKRILVLPCSTNISHNELKYAADAVKTIIRRSL